MKNIYGFTVNISHEINYLSISVIILTIVFSLFSLYIAYKIFVHTKEISVEHKFINEYKEDIIENLEKNKKGEKKITNEIILNNDKTKDN